MRRTKPYGIPVLSSRKPQNGTYGKLLWLYGLGPSLRHTGPIQYERRTLLMVLCITLTIPLFTAITCAGLSSLNSTTRPSGNFNTEALYHRRYQISAIQISFVVGLCQYSSLRVQPRPLSHEFDNPVLLPPSRKSSLKNHALP